MPIPERVLQAQQRRGAWRLLIQWRGLPEEEATWESREDFTAAYPEFQLEDKLFAKAGRDVMTGLTYRGEVRKVARRLVRQGAKEAIYLQIIIIRGFLVN